MLCWRLELVPDDHGVVDCMAARISLDLESNDIASPSRMDHGCNPFELRVALVNAVITEVFNFFDPITDHQSRLLFPLLLLHWLNVQRKPFRGYELTAMNCQLLRALAEADLS